jgi:6-phosphogluconate dehydrogenase
LYGTINNRLLGGINLKVGLIGLGRMGYNLALNMRDNKYDVHAFNRSREKVDEVIEEGIKGYYTVEEMVLALDDRKVIWMMIPAGNPIDNMIDTLLPMLKENDILIDGGNSFYTDTLRRGDYLQQYGIHYIDAGTSGGIDGARNGACMMVGGDKEPIDYLENFFKSLNVENGYLHCGHRGSGHYVKMVHNGIEYGMMQAIGEGFSILDKCPFKLDHEAVARVWSNGSIIEGLLMTLTEKVFQHNEDLNNIIPIVDASGEGEWTVLEAVRLKVSAPIISNSLFIRYSSKDKKSYSNKVVSALRNEFGGHKIHKG